MKQRLTTGIAGIILGMYIGTGANMFLLSDHTDHLNASVSVVDECAQYTSIPNPCNPDSNN